MKKKKISFLIAMALAFSMLQTENVKANESQTPNPTYQVQYYAYTENIKLVEYKDDSQYLPVIDTSGKKYPTNSNSMIYNQKELSPNGNSVKSILLNSDGTLNTTPNFSEIYTHRELDFRKYPRLSLYNLDSENYILSEVWVAKEGTTADSVKRDDWTVYCLARDEYRSPGYDHLITSFDIDENEPETGTWQLTNDSELADPDDIHNWEDPDSDEGDGIYYIHVTDDTIIRLVYIATESERVFDNVSFYDYDITEDGTTTAKKSDNINERGQGINSDINYQGKNGIHFAIGNANGGTGMNNIFWNGNVQFNQINTFSYGGCAYGLVKGLNKDGTLIWSDGVAVPNLFNESTDVKGKTTYDDFKMIFSQKGDTYTLIRAENDDGIAAENLDKFTMTSGGFTNLFWPLDKRPGVDGLKGETDNRGKYIGYNQGTVSRPNNTSEISTYNSNGFNAQWSDDGFAHNFFFGMHQEVEFMTEEDYLGPLEFIFYGDDDLFIFLSKADEDGNYTDAQLICDLGGVHLSDGEYVNLRDFVGYGSTGMYKLSIFYMERGASGSTCWMQFTLPSLHLSTVEETHFDIDIDVYNKLDTMREYDDKEKVVNLFNVNKTQK